MNRRSVVMALGGVAAITLSGRTLAQVELEETPLDQDMDSSVATPTSDQPMYQGDVEDLWRSPWSIGRDLIEIGITIVQRFPGTEDRGYRLRLDGLVVQSVIYSYYGFERNVYIGFNTDLSELKDAKTLVIVGSYAGVHQSTDTRWETPILLATEVELP